MRCGGSGRLDDDEVDDDDDDDDDREYSAPDDDSEDEITESRDDKYDLMVFVTGSCVIWFVVTLVVLFASDATNDSAKSDSLSGGRRNWGSGSGSGKCW